MRQISKVGLISCVLWLSGSAMADCGPRCCEGYGGILYNDSSMGRFVCRNGYISNCYSTRHAVMDMQKFRGCCVWEGGIEKITMKGEVVCRDGHISEICSIAHHIR